MDAIIDENKKSWLQRFILWREKKIREKHFILILSFLAGIFTALAAWFLKFLVEWIKEFLTENFDSTLPPSHRVHPESGGRTAGLS